MAWGFKGAPNRDICDGHAIPKPPAIPQKDGTSFSVLRSLQPSTVFWEGGSLVPSDNGILCITSCKSTCLITYVRLFTALYASFLECHLRTVSIPPSTLLFVDRCQPEASLNLGAFKDENTSPCHLSDHKYGSSTVPKQESQVAEACMALRNEKTSFPEERSPVRDPPTARRASIQTQYRSFRCPFKASHSHAQRTKQLSEFCRRLYRGRNKQCMYTVKIHIEARQCAIDTITDAELRTLGVFVRELRNFSCGQNCIIVSRLC